MKCHHERPAFLLICTFTLLLLTSYGQDEKKQSEAYSAVAVGTRGSVGGRTMQFDFSIIAYTSDEELTKFALLLKEKGSDALRDALDKEDKGQLSTTGRVGNQIALARKRRVGADTIITIVTARIMPFIELYNNGRSTDYPFGFLQVKLNEKNEGTDKSWRRPRSSLIRRKAATKLRATAINTSKQSTYDSGNKHAQRLR